MAVLHAAEWNSCSNEMRKLLTNLHSMHFSDRSVPWLLLLVAVLAYGLLFWARGFYWDEAPWAWIYYRLGPEALTRTFSTSRPFWGLIYQLTMPVIGPHPWRWQVLMVLMRWLTSVLVWVLLRKVWPINPRPALWTSLLFLVYPGLGQNFMALMYTHFYIVLNCLLLSLYLSVLAMQRPDKGVLWSIAALILSLVNLMTMEYFYFLELVRVLLFWMGAQGPWRAKLRPTAIRYVPYFAVFVGVSVWRAFFFKNQNASYEYAALNLIRHSPLEGLWVLMQSVVLSFWETVARAWIFSYALVNPSILGPRTITAAVGVVLVTAVLTGFYLYRYRRPSQSDRAWAGQSLILGASAWLLAGGSFWLVGIQPELHFSSDRFTMPFMLGSSLLVAGLLALLASRPRIQYVLLGLLVGFSVGRQFLTNSTYVHDWATQRTFFWQMLWRIPSLKPSAIVLTNDLPVTYFSDNSLSAPLNWIYSSPGRLDNMLFFASVRLNRALPELRPGLPVEQNYLAAVFHGNTSEMIVVNFAPPACVRVLDPEIDDINRLLPPQLRDAAFLSNVSLIRSGPSIKLPSSMYGSEISHGWCYYFERASLAAQEEDWEAVTKLAEVAFRLDDHPNDPIERFVFVEGYAHVGNWSRAIELSEESYGVSRSFVGPVLCRLWGRIERETAGGAGQQAALSEVKSMLACSGE